MAEAQDNMNKNGNSSDDMPDFLGPTSGDEGWLDTAAGEPEVYPSEYPFSQQQRFYTYWGIAIAMLVAALALILTLGSYR